MDDLIFRPAIDSDSEFVYQVKKATFQEYVEQVWGWEEAEQWQFHRRRFDFQKIIIVQFRGEDAGFMAMARDLDCVQLHQLFILPERQGHGIGSACVNHLIGITAARELPIRLQTLKVNTPAQEFFKGRGFVPVGETDTHILMEKPNQR
jgi:GNAT superfamily N-acetyltransferase